MITRLFPYAHFGIKVRLRNIGSSVTLKTRSPVEKVSGSHSRLCSGSPNLLTQALPYLAFM